MFIKRALKTGATLSRATVVYHCDVKAVKDTNSIITF